MNRIDCDRNYNPERMELPVKPFVSRTLNRCSNWLVFICAIAVSGMLLTGCEKERILNHSYQQIIHSSYYPLLATHHLFPVTDIEGGGIAAIDDQWLIATGAGDFLLFKRSESGDDFRIKQLPYRVPINRKEFADTAPLDEDKLEKITGRFRVADLVLNRSGDLLQIWVSHHWWKKEESCFVLRVSTAITPVDEFLQETLPGLDWKTLFETTPCITIQESAFAGHETGGKIALSGSPTDTLYLTVGYHGFDGIKQSPAYSQDPAASWGKVMKIGIENGAATVYTSGHRNAQGLFLDNLGRMWLTEHGPRGGDELNLLEPGENYGWPLVTFGSEYDTYDPWPLSKRPGHHDGFQLPVYAWVPSIGVSDIIRLQSGRFPLWNGDLIAGSLKMQSLYRVNISEGRAVVIEKIDVTKGIRDLAEGPNGEIAIWSDDGRVIFIEPSDNLEYPD